MNFPPNHRKATDAVARLIERAGGQIDYLRVVKLIYLADRQSILERGTPIVGGRYFSMRQGPVVSEIMDCVNRQTPPRWQTTIAPRRGNKLALTSQTTYDSLSSPELEILDSVSEKFAHLSTAELVEWCHENCPEYEHVTGSQRKPIGLEAILHAAKKSPEQIAKLVARARELQELDALLA